MTPEAYQMEMQRRGFVFDAQRNEWRGPFGLIQTGALNNDGPDPLTARAIDHAYARVDVLRQLDEYLRAKRGLPRPPLVKPVDPSKPNFEPYKQIPPPRA